MLKKDNFFKNNFINSKKYYENIKKTKKIYNSFLIDLKNFKIPLHESYEKNYKFDFSTTTVNPLDRESIYGVSICSISPSKTILEFSPTRVTIVLSSCIVKF